MTSHAKTGSLEPKKLCSGNYADRCEDCGTQIVGASVDDVLAATCACQSQRRVRYVAELVCLMCGADVGTATVPHVDARMLIPHTLRCPKCGGSPVVDDFYRVSDYPELPKIRGRRGRPPGSRNRTLEEV